MPLLGVCAVIRSNTVSQFYYMLMSLKLLDKWPTRFAASDRAYTVCMPACPVIYVDCGNILFTGKTYN